MYTVLKEFITINISIKKVDSVSTPTKIVIKEQEIVIIIVGGDSIEGTPDPIPNSEVKLYSAEGSSNARIGHCQLFL